MKAIRIHEFGGPEVLTYEECPSPSLGASQVRVDIQAVGVNYSDIYIRSGRSRYNLPLHFPMTLGVEAAGVVSALGDGVTEVEVGDAVAYGGLELMGSYAEPAVVPADRLIKLPDGVDARLSAAVLFKA
jgi:NADPH2:quinone reductase